MLDKIVIDEPHANKELRHSSSITVKQLQAIFIRILLTFHREASNTNDEKVLVAKYFFILLKRNTQSRKSNRSISLAVFQV